MKAALPIEVDPEIMSGTPVFTGTRVPVETLFDYLINGSSVEEFLECFPTVDRRDALLILGHSKRETLHHALAYASISAALAAIQPCQYVELAIPGTGAPYS